MIVKGKYVSWMTAGLISLIVLLLCGLSSATVAAARRPQSAQASIAKQVGVIKAMSGQTITLAPDSGGDVSVIVLDNTKIVRVAPGQTDLKNAAVIHLADLQVGDRIFVRGIASADAKSLTAAGIIVMKHSDVAARQQQDREDWQKRGIGGVVSSVDPAAGTVTISVTSVSGKKYVVIQTARKTVLRRYAPGSVKFDDAKPSPLDQIRPGDQLRARGTRSADGTEFAAEEIVSGSFRNIEGTIESVDSAANTITVRDLIAKSPVVVKISDQSQIRKLPLPIAQRIALRLKASTADTSGGNTPGTPPKEGAGSAPASSGSSSLGASRQESTGAPGSGHGAGQADFQQIVNRMPAVTLADLQKGDAVMIVATLTPASGQVTAITVLDGVEPILTASPSQAREMTLSPWSINEAPAAEGGGEGNP